VDHTADVLGALLIAIDRFETAQRDGNVDGQMLQGAVFATLAGMLAEAERAEDAAENRFAAELRRLGIRHEASSRGTQRIQRNLAAMRGIPASVTRPLRTRGYSKAELRDLFRTTFGGKAFRPVKSESLLRRKTDISAFEADHRSIRLVEIRAIVSSFAASGAFNAEQAATLRADLDAADAAATPQDRAAAVGTLIEHASAFRGAASQFLRFAAGPLASA
jgi:hypothetical protein